jgi:NAD(P)-dependent dehydrogenase (short-subunit alcohol dehydrogenase family)
MTVAMVTGASRGIGRATALALAEAGFTVAAVARSRTDLEETCALLVERGVPALSIVADVTDSHAVHEAVAEIEERAGDIAVLVNGAGSLLAIGPVWEVDPDDWWTDVRTSLGGAFACCREVLPRMIERGSGRIVNLTSYAAVRPAPYETGYAAAKAGLGSLTEALADSLEQHGVKVFAVAPGFTRTAMTRNMLESEAGRRWLPEIGRGRIVEPERSAQLVAWLASGAGDDLTGRILHTLDDRERMMARIDEIRRDELYVARVRRLPDEATPASAATFEPGG